MKKILLRLIFFILLISPAMLSAAWLEDVPQTLKQPDGSVIHCLATGDEYYNWLHDENDFTIIQSPTDGYYYYAVLQDGKLVPSHFRADRADPKSVGLRPNINIAAEAMLEKRMDILRKTPQKPVKDLSMLGQRSEGTMNNIVIYIRFNDQDEFSQDTLTYYNWFNASEEGDNSMYNYFYEASYEKLSIFSWFYPESANEIILSYQDYHDRSYFMPYNAQTNPNGYQDGDERTEREHNLLKDAVEYVNQNYPIPQSLDLDYDDDDFVDNVVFIIRGQPTAWATLLWPHRWVLFSENVEINGKRVWDYNFQIESRLNSSGVGVLCHEMFHSLGSPDLYHYTGNGITPVGPWDIMEQDNNPPQYMGAYMKYKYGGWIDSIPEITETGTYYVNPLQDSVNNVWKVGSLNHDKQFFVIEYRKTEGTFEENLPASGLLIYRIDTTAGNGNAGGPPDEVYLFRPNGTVNENGVINEAVFGIDHDRTEFNDNTNPACFLQNGDPGGLYISDISAVGDSMSFFVEFPGPPDADFEAEITMDCAGKPIRFYDETIGIPDQWDWSFEPNTVDFVEGTDANSQNPVVVFQENGYYDVTLIASNEFDTDIAAKYDYIEIGSFDADFSENFETVAFNTNSWQVENPDGDATWEIAEVAGNSPGNHAVRIDFRNIFMYGQRDRLISPPISLDGLGSAHLHFEHAYAQYNAQVSDSLIIYISDDCEESWTRIFAAAEDGSGNFATHPLTTDPFVPEVADDWCFAGYGSGCNTVDISNWIGEEPVKIAFESFSLFGNPLYIDNVGIGETVGRPENLTSAGLNVFPNPSSGIFNIHNLSLPEDAELLIYNTQGKLVKNLKIKAGQDQYDFDLSALPDGLYLISVKSEASQWMKKIMKN